VYRRAELSRTFVLVVALLLTAVSTGAFACESRIPDPQKGAADLNRTKFALLGTMTPELIGRLRRVDRI
jgi:hypothetical protein